MDGHYHGNVHYHGNADFQSLTEDPISQQVKDSTTIDKTAPMLVFPVLACFPAISFFGHFGTCICNPTRTAKNGKYVKLLVAIGCLYITVGLLMVLLPGIAVTSMVSDDTVTIPEVITTAWGLVIGEIVLAFLSLALWIAGIVICFQAYNFTKAECNSALQRSRPPRWSTNSNHFD